MGRGVAAFKVVAGTAVDADPELVERFLLDPGCFATWQHGMSGDIRATTPVLSTGTALEMTGRIGPFRLPYTIIVSEHVPGRNLSVRTTRGAVDLLVDFRWAREAGLTRMDVTIDGRSTRAKSWLVPVLGAASRRNLQRNLDGLRRTLERGDFAFTVPSPLTDHPPHSSDEPLPAFP